MVFSFDSDSLDVSVEQSQRTNFFFVSAEFAVVLIAQGTIHLLKTEQRHLKKPFTKLLTVETGVSDGVLLTGKCRVCVDESRTQIDVLICSVRKKNPDESTEFPESVQFLSVLTWLTFEGKGAANNESSLIQWELRRTRTLCGTAVPKFTKFIYNSGASYLLVCSECQYKFEHDSLVPVVILPPKIDDQKESSVPPLYTYVQNNEDVVVVFRLGPDTSTRDVCVTIMPSTLEIKIRGEVVLEGALETVVDSGSSTWSIVDNKLEVTLMKCRAQRWKRVVKGDSKGEEVFEAAYLSEVHERLRHLTATDDDLDKMKSEKSARECGTGFGETAEECDEAAEDFCLVVFNGETHARDWFLDLSSHQFVMEVSSKDGPLVVLRHHVDGLVWNFDFDNQRKDRIHPRHISTLHAFGYVSASKQDKQFMSCHIPAASEVPESDSGQMVPRSTRGEYAAIVSTNGQVYIYKSPEPVEGCQLKNRKTGQVQHVAKQYAVRLECAGLNQRTDGVLGASAGNGALFVLTRDRLHVIPIK
ncbi:nudC domain-containing protein 1-like [Tropilaelaps mercedesae]|uniref:NudC domain-containing protein 1 n=1 Tax=Tropilaelaps mercedesae TaxID=418985 RepID=A0A1V9X174_9ACAR|nr:nudC domain-containing protein 1-like [Tropilaelaps mercedesae]